MKIKKIMLITLLLFAVLTIGAVSAADDTASENLTVTDEAASDNLAVDDAVADEELIGLNYDSEHYIEVNIDEITLTNDEETIADIYLPTNAKGSFKIFNGNEEVINLNVDENDEDHWIVDENDDGEEYLWGTIYLGDLNINKINTGDILSFKFFELHNKEYTLVDSFTVECQVTKTDSTMELTDIGDSGMTEEDVEIQVNNINTTNPDENFTYVEVTIKQGIFKITVDDNEDDEIDIFSENLNTTQRQCTIIDDGKGNKTYRFGFSFTDINNYLQNSEYKCTFFELNENGFINGNDMYFYLNEDDADETEIDSKTMSFQIKNGMILFKDEDELVDVNPADELEITMNGTWKESEVLTFTVKSGTKGKIVICLNDNSTPVFEKNIRELTPDEDSDDEYEEYTFKISDLNITQAGRYVIKERFEHENGTVIYQYDEEDLIILIIHEPQITYIDNVSINIDKRSMQVDGNESFITISANASAEEYVQISIDGGKPTSIQLNTTRLDEEDNYIIGTKELGIRPAAGQHTINITYKNQNVSGIINLRSNIEIVIESKETIYTTFEKSFVEITLEEGEILKSDINGTIKVIIKDADGKIVDTFESNITELEQDDESYIICVKADTKLNGTYKVIVSYSKGNEIDTEAQANVTFKSFDPKESNATIKESINDKKDSVITFANLPQTAKINVQIDDGNIIPFDVSEVESWLDNGVYYIKFNKLQELSGETLSDGTHSIYVYVESENCNITLASGNVIVDVVENIDPELSISIVNITEGKDAVINIKTHANYSGIIPVKIGNVTYNVNVTNGTGSLAVPGLVAGNYNATAVFNANAFYNASTKNTTFTVKAKVATSISAANVATTYATSKNIIVTLKDANGKVLAEKIVSVVFNGKTSTIKTNAKGQVSLAIGTKLAPKTYPVTFSFAGDDELLASSGSANVIVKKAKAKLTAKKKTFKAKKKIKKYTITLKSDKGKAIKNAKVTIKVKGKTYKAKTNSKGKATFKIKKLTKRGKHKATVKFAGNKYYNKVTKKVRITVKK